MALSLVTMQPKCTPLPEGAEEYRQGRLEENESFARGARFITFFAVWVLAGASFYGLWLFLSIHCPWLFR